MKKYRAEKSGEVCAFCNKYIQWGGTYLLIPIDMKEVFSNSISRDSSYITCNVCYNKLCDGEKLKLYNE